MEGQKATADTEVARNVLDDGEEAARAEQVPDPEEEETEKTELVLFHAKECYVYMIPPRKSAASYRADEWNINKWAWEGTMRIVSKGDNCTIRLEDKTTGELYAQAPILADQPHPVEAVIDSSRFFVLRIEDNSSGHTRHAFIGIGFRDRSSAYDFQAAVYDHLKYLNKKKHAEELEQEYQSKPSMDYSLKEGETLRLHLQLKSSSSSSTKSKFFDQNLDAFSVGKDVTSPRSSATTPGLATVPCLVPPPPPPASPVNTPSAPSSQSPSSQSSEFGTEDGEDPDPLKLEHGLDDDFGDFQTAG